MAIANARGRDHAIAIALVLEPEEILLLLDRAPIHQSGGSDEPVEASCRG